MYRVVRCHNVNKIFRRSSSSSSSPIKPPVSLSPSVPSQSSSSTIKKKGGLGLGFYLTLLTGAGLYATYEVEQESFMGKLIAKYLPDVLPYIEPIRKQMRPGSLIGNAIGIKAKVTNTKPKAPINTEPTTPPPPPASTTTTVTTPEVKTTQEVSKKEIQEELSFDELLSDISNDNGDSSVVTDEKKSSEVSSSSSSSSLPVVESSPVIEKKEPTPVFVPATVVVVEKPVFNTVEKVVPSASQAEELMSSLPIVPSEIRSKNLHNETAAEILDEITIQSAALRKELEITLLRDLNELDEHQLRVRVSQLAAEFFERTKWEGIRLHQSLQQLEAELTRRYQDILKQQREELQYEAKRVLIMRENQLNEHSTMITKDMLSKHEEQLKSSLQTQANEFNTLLDKEVKSKALQIQSELEDELKHHVAVIRNEHVKELMTLQESIESIKSSLLAFNSIVEDNSWQGKSSIVHKQSAALLALESALYTSKPFIKEYKTLAKECKDDELASSLLTTISEKVAESGALTIPELKTRFVVVRNEMRKAALAPVDAQSLIGQTIGNVLAAISYAPTGPIKGDGVEEILSRVTFQLNQGNLLAATKELDNVQGYPRKLMSDWLQLANARLQVDEASKGLRTVSILRHGAFK